ncbi:MAG: VOC family protein [Ignavibacteriae bacterium]|nr:VOC family protein [Ignavibacteriota bacterium]
MAVKNAIGWFEIYVNDFDSAIKFYGGLFNWEFKQSQSTGSSYWNIFTGEGSIGGGFMKKEKPEYSGSSVILYIEVESIEDALIKVVELGGKTHTPKTMINENAGSFGLFNDPDGNLIGLWSKN